MFTEKVSGVPVEPVSVDEGVLCSELRSVRSTLMYPEFCTSKLTLMGLVVSVQLFVYIRYNNHD